MHLLDIMFHRLGSALSDLVAQFASSRAPDSAHTTTTYFFDVRRGARIFSDKTGASAASDAEAIQQATAAAQEFLKETERRGESVTIDEIIIRDRERGEIARVDMRPAEKN